MNNIEIISLPRIDVNRIDKLRELIHIVAYVPEHLMSGRQLDLVFKLTPIQNNFLQQIKSISIVSDNIVYGKIEMDDNEINTKLTEESEIAELLLRFVIPESTEFLILKTYHEDNDFIYGYILDYGKVHMLREAMTNRDVARILYEHVSDPEDGKIEVFMKGIRIGDSFKCIQHLLEDFQK